MRQKELYYSTEKMPVLFLGHGSLMNAIKENEIIHVFNDKAVAGSLTMTSIIIGQV